MDTNNVIEKTNIIFLRIHKKTFWNENESKLERMGKFAFDTVPMQF